MLDFLCTNTAVCACCMPRPRPVLITCAKRPFMQASMQYPACKHPASTQYALPLYSARYSHHSHSTLMCCMCSPTGLPAACYLLPYHSAHTVQYRTHSPNICALYCIRQGSSRFQAHAHAPHCSRRSSHCSLSIRVYYIAATCTTSSSHPSIHLSVHDLKPAS